MIDVILSQDTRSASPMLAHALNYAENWNWLVFPAPIGKKKSHKSEKYSGTPWGATRDLDEIRKDFTKWPDANIGIPTGKDNDNFVFDVDTIEGHGKDGFASLAALETEHGKLPDTLMAESPSGSIHYFFKHPGFDVKNSESEIADGIDIRGDGGMVIVAPSRKEGGSAWRWLNAPHAIAKAPQWLEVRIKNRIKNRVKDEQRTKNRVGTAGTAPTGLRPLRGLQPARALEEACRIVAAAEEGTRNGVLNDQAFFVGHWVGSGEIGADVAAHDLLIACDECGLIADDGADQCMATIHSGLAAGAKEPARTLDDMFPPDFIRQIVADTTSPPLAPALPHAEFIKSSAEFLRGFVAPDYILDGVLQRGFCYSMTAKTGTGKTAVAMCFSAHVATGRALNGLYVAQGDVIYLAGENPTDIQMRWLGLTQEMRIDPETVPVYFLPGVISISQNVAAITQEVKDKCLTPTLIVVDTAAAYFEGDNENDNVQQGNNARLLRSLTLLPGSPCVLVLCHPTKRAGDDDLLPRGGGAFLNEVDGNIALKSNDTIIGAEVQGKFRGPAFSPLAFKLDAVREHPLLKDSKGRSIPTVIARAISEGEMASNHATQERDENRLLRIVEKHPKASLQELANLMGGAGKSKVNRLVQKLVDMKLIRREGRKIVLTQIGQKELNDLEMIVSPSFQPPFPSVPFPPLPPIRN
ncbi:MAG: bifunctional DNA primase/polymerase [Xanthobacteraceae bacterium]